MRQRKKKKKENLSVRKSAEPKIRLNRSCIVFAIKAEGHLIETAAVRKAYARWCGGTAVRAASYPINKLARKENFDSNGVARQMDSFISINILTLWVKELINFV